MGASLSAAGVFNQTKYSSSTGKNTEYLAVRQGNSPQKPLGNIVVSVDSDL
jgi:hypothetical protein